MKRKHELIKPFPYVSIHRDLAGCVFNVFDIGGSAVMSVGALTDTALRRPRPLMMVKEKDGLGLYSERSYVVIATK